MQGLGKSKSSLDPPPDASSLVVQFDPPPTPKEKPKDALVPFPLWRCQAAAAATQAAFVVGSVYLKSSLLLVDAEAGEVFNPIVYAFIREATAGPILYVLACLARGPRLPQRRDVLRIAALGACMFLSQLFYIVGIDESGVTVATCMQPAIPVFTVMLGILLQMETGNSQKLVGIGMAVVGAVSMVVGGIANAAHHHGPPGQEQGNLVLGNTCLLINTLAMACYYILAKQALQRYPPISVACWAYLVAATCMGAAALLFTSAPDWHFPAAVVGPLVYWILVCSVLGYFVITWAMRHLPASQVAAFQCLQPFIGTLLAATVLGEEPTWWDAGAVGVVAGLFLVAADRKDFETAALMARARRLLAAARSLPLLQVGPGAEHAR